MMKNSIIELPESLEKYRDKIEKTIKPYVK